MIFCNSKVPKEFTARVCACVRACVCGCVCVCEWMRERERDVHIDLNSWQRVLVFDVFVYIECKYVWNWNLKKIKNMTKKKKKMWCEENVTDRAARIVGCFAANRGRLLFLPWLKQFYLQTNLMCYISVDISLTLNTLLPYFVQSSYLSSNCPTLWEIVSLYLTFGFGLSLPQDFRSEIFDKRLSGVKGAHAVRCWLRWL